MDSVEDCDTCKHEDKKWSQDPCGSCFESSSKWEPVEMVQPSEPTPDLSNNAIVQQGWTPSSVNAAKPANPKQLYGDKKPPLHLIHSIAQLHESAALHGGRRKYGENNYLETPVEVMTYLGAILRHTQQYISGERVDAKELVHHMGAVRACANIILTAEACGTLIDNRPKAPFDHCNEPAFDSRRPPTYQEATAEAFAEVEKTIEHLNKLYPEK